MREIFLRKKCGKLESFGILLNNFIHFVCKTQEVIKKFVVGSLLEWKRWIINKKNRDWREMVEVYRFGIRCYRIYKNYEGISLVVRKKEET